MTYLLIVFVLALALAPIFALMPSKRQKLQMELRDRARQIGLQVLVCDIPQTRRQQVRQQRTEQGVVYRRLWEHSEMLKKQFQYIRVRGDDNPEPMPSEIKVQLEQLLFNLPDSVRAVDCATVGLGVYWKEEGSQDDVSMIKEQLDAVKIECLSALSNN